MSGLTQSDNAYLLKQNQDRLDMIVACMTSIIIDTEQKCVVFQSQAWAKRMFAAALGVKRANSETIKNNGGALRAYCAEALMFLYQHDRIPDSLSCNLEILLCDIQNLYPELKTFFAAFSRKIISGNDNPDRYFTLCQEIEHDSFGVDSNPFWIYRLAAEMEERTLQDTRKTDLLKTLLLRKNIISSEPVSAEEFVMGVLTMPEKHAGAVYLELLNYSGSTSADLATAAIDRWHMQPGSNRQYLKRETIAARILKEFEIDPKVEISLGIEFDHMVETKMIRILSELEREYERKQRQQEFQANIRDNLQGFQSNVQKGVQGIQTNVKKHLPTVKEFFSNLASKIKGLSARRKERAALAQGNAPPSGWVKAVDDSGLDVPGQPGLSDPSRIDAESIKE